MTAFSINPTNQSVVEIEVSETQPQFTTEVSKLIGDPDFQIIRSSDKTMVLIFGANALLNDETLVFSFSLISRPIFGNMLILGTNPITGDYVSRPYSTYIEELSVRFYNKEETVPLRKSAFEYVRQLHLGR